ncbi:MAG: folate-binding protein YgfZ [Alphaproteobacteria bacterium]|nr:folate-binding protein YgfZ [Alphaproteobacteria bacterium]
MSNHNAPILLETRAIITISGPDRRSFLQGLVTGNVEKIAEDAMIYAALLTPQGKYLHDFFISAAGGKLWLDCERDRRADLLRRLMMYKLRAQVEIADGLADYIILATADKIETAVISCPDPRHSGLGYRTILPAKAAIPGCQTEDAYDHLRLGLGLPDGSRDFRIDGTLILEGNMAELNGVDFDKGCYVGQEVTARMKYRASLKKRLLPVTVTGPLPPPTTIITTDSGKKIGDIRSGQGAMAIGYFRLADMVFGHSYACGDAMVSPWRPDWLKDLIG